MDTNAAIREQVNKLIALGVNQKVVAREMGVSESWVSRWLGPAEKVARDRRPPIVNADQIDRLIQYLNKLLDAIESDAATLIGEALELRRLAGQVNSRNRPDAIAYLAEILQRQPPTGNSASSPAVAAEPTRRKHAGTPHGPKASSVRTVAASGRSRKG